MKNDASHLRNSQRTGDTSLVSGKACITLPTQMLQASSSDKTESAETSPSNANSGYLGMPFSKSVARRLIDIRWVSDFDLRLEILQKNLVEETVTSFAVLQIISHGSDFYYGPRLISEHDESGFYGIIN